jgi:hypothetical protein
MDPRIQRHIDACNNAVLPGERLAFCLGDQPVGWVTRPFARALCRFDAISMSDHRVGLADATQLHEIGRSLAEEGFYRHRGEAFDVRAEPGGPSLGTLDRGALPSFGVLAEGVHVNGLVRRADGLHLWVARRAADKLLDPGKLDHLAAGGVSAGMTAWETLVKESAEEADLPASLVQGAVHVAVIDYAMERPEGLRRDRLQCYDLMLPEAFTPVAADGEVASFELWPISRVVETVRDTDDFKFNVNLVLVDLFSRLGLV